MAGEDKALTIEDFNKSLTTALTGLAAFLGQGTAKNTTYKDILKLTPASAKALLTQAAEAAQFTGKFTSEDISTFIAEFSSAANKQIETVIKQVRDNAKPGDSEKAIADAMTTAITTTYKSYFDPKEFANNYVWGKINFADSATLAGKSLTALQSARQAVKDYNLLSVSEAEIQASAKAIAMGKKSITDYKAELQQKAITEHPFLADRFKSTPGLSYKDIASPAINVLAKIWEMDPEQIGIDEPLVQQYMNPIGADGKGTQLNYSDLIRAAKAHSRYNFTMAANDEARDSATALGRALGGGI